MRSWKDTTGLHHRRRRAKRVSPPVPDMVDLYGYTSMAVAALQLQARQIEALKKELESLRRQIEETRDHRDRAGSDDSAGAAFGRAGSR